MPRIPDEIIDRIRDSTDIVEVVSEYVQLKQNGRNYLGLCPFHRENTPSFSVNPDLQIYKCFGCGAGGPIFKFIQEIDRVSFVEAVSFLAQRCGIDLPQHPADRDQNAFLDPLYRANELARKYFHHLLTEDEQGREALEYLRSRHLTDETVERFGLGYAPPAWDDFIQVARNRQLQPDVLEKAGLASPGQRGHYDRFRDRLTFPIANLSGRTIAFGARALKSDQEPKYLNSPETPVYRKSAVLYGLHQTRDAIRREGAALVVEGYMDLLSLVQQGIHNVVASAGTALTEEQCRALGRYARQVVLVFDGDAAGSAAARRGVEVVLSTHHPVDLVDLDVDAARRGVEVVLSTGLEARAVSLPEGHDPDTFVQEKGPDALLDAVKTAGSALDFYLEQLGRQWNLSTLDGKARAAEAVRPLLAHCRDTVRRDLMLREVAQRLGIDEKAIRQELQQNLNRRNFAHRSREQESAPVQEELPLRERQFLGLLLKFPRFIAPTARQLKPEVFSNPQTQASARILFERHGDATPLDLSHLLSGIEDETLVRLISTCAMEGFDETQVEQQWQDYLRRFQKDALKRRIDSTKIDLRKADDSGDKNAVARINQTLEGLVKEFHSLNS